jgi:glycosyltransferase involved in cell wall biosynthesis
MNNTCMKVLLIGNYGADNQYSMLGFANAMLDGLSAAGVETRLIAPRTVVGKFGHPNRGFGKWLGYADKYLFFPGDLQKAVAWADITHVCDHGNAMYVKHLEKVPHLVTCHDVLAIRSAIGDLKDWSTSRTGKVFQQQILDGLKKASLVACVSDATRQDLLRISGRDPERTRVALNGLYSHYERMPEGDSQAALKRLGISGPYVLHVGGNQPYKNRIGLLKIFDQLRRISEWSGLRLVMAGKPPAEAMRAYITDNGLAECVTEAVGLSNDDLRALYSQALGLIFPSLHEGFGVPILEAQACGCPVFTSNRAPMTEVGGDSVAYFDPADPVAAAQTIAAGLKDRGSLAERGYANSKHFTTESMIDRYIALYRQALSGSAESLVARSAS